MGQQRKLGTHRTTVVRDLDGILRVTYHETDVVTVLPDKILLNTGGWYSSTTKTRMNQASNQFSLGYHVYQKNYSWFVDYRNKTYQFENNICELV